MQTQPRLVLRTVRHLLPAPAAVILMLVAGLSLTVGAATILSERWIAGGLSAGIDSAGQAARIASDASGNVVVVSGPSGGRDLAVTSYTAEGILRWRRTVTPALGTFVGDWVVAAPDGDFVAIGHNQDSHGRPIASTMLRYDSNGTLLWRVDFSASFFPAVARIVVDAAGNTYVAWSAVGSGLFVQKYGPSGALLWSQQDSTGGGYAVASSLALSPDGADVAVTGSVSGGATWITAVYDATTGVRRWQATAAEGTAARGVVADATRVYVTGQGVTGAGTPALKYYLTVVAYDRTTGARLWRTDKKPADAYDAAGLWMATAPDGSLVVTGQTNRGFLDWYTVAFETTGAVRWEAVRDGGLNTDEIPAGVLVLADGTTVVTGKGGPNLPGGYIPGVTAGYSAGGELLWEAFSRMATVWATALPNGDVCAAGGYDAFITCWRVSGGVRADMSAEPSTGVAPLLVTFDGSGFWDSQRNGDLVGMVIWRWRLRHGASDHPSVHGSWNVHGVPEGDRQHRSVERGHAFHRSDPFASGCAIRSVCLAIRRVGRAHLAGQFVERDCVLHRAMPGPGLHEFHEFRQPVARRCELHRLHGDCRKQLQLPRPRLQRRRVLTVFEHRHRHAGRIRRAGCADEPGRRLGHPPPDRPQVEQHRHQRDVDYRGALRREHVHGICRRRSALRNGDDMERFGGEVALDLSLSCVRVQRGREIAVLEHRERDGALTTEAGPNTDRPR